MLKNLVTINVVKVRWIIKMDALRFDSCSQSQIGLLTKWTHLTDLHWKLSKLCEGKKYVCWCVFSRPQYLLTYWCQIKLFFTDTTLTLKKTDALCYNIVQWLWQYKSCTDNIYSRHNLSGKEMCLNLKFILQTFCNIVI